jgi:hypothetical protein
MRRLMMQTHVQSLYKQKRGLELQWEQHYNDEGRYTLDMVKIDNKIKEVINHIKMAEAKEASHISKIEDAAPQVSVAT